MAFTFDTLGYQASVGHGHCPPAGRGFIMVTKQDLALAIDNIKLAMDNMMLSLTIRLSSMFMAGIVTLALLQLIY
jgi:hypothetical protein